MSYNTVKKWRYTPYGTIYKALRPGFLRFDGALIHLCPCSAVTVSEDWQGLAGKGANAPTFGIVVGGCDEDLAPLTAHLNGASCSLAIIV